RDDGDFVTDEPYEIADGEESHQVHEAFEQWLAERRVALLAHDGADANGREALPIWPIAAQRVEDVRDRDDLRAQIELAAADSFRITAQVLLEMMLEGDDGRQRGHLGRAPQNVRAVDHVLLHHFELVLL